MICRLLKSLVTYSLDFGEVKNMKKIEYFRFWCQKVLPLVYDDSLSYYELLCKVVDYLNSIIKDTNHLIDMVESLKTDFDNLKEWVENYLDNINLQIYIDNKLDEMAKDGTLSAIIEQFINGNLDNASLFNNTSNSTLKNSTVHSLSNYYFNGNKVDLSNGISLEETEEQAFNVYNKNNYSLFPRPNTTPINNGGIPLGAICVGATYLNSDVTYGRDTGMFNVNGQVFKQMVCSDYLWAIMKGISYGNSKCSGKAINIQTPYRCTSCFNEKSLLAPVEKNAFITRELAWYFAGSGRLNELDYKYYSNIQIGDFIFVAYTSDTSPTKANYLNIGHCGMVINIDYNNHILYVMECGAPSKPLFQFDWVTNTTESCNAPSIDEYYVDESIVNNNYKLYVATPSWNNISPRKVLEKHISYSGGITEEYSTIAQLNYNNDEFTYNRSDVIVAKIHGNFNSLNSGLSDNNTFNVRIISNYSDRGFNLVCRNYLTGNKKILANDLLLIGVIQSVKALTSIPLQIRSIMGGNLSVDGTIEVYRL